MPVNTQLASEQWDRYVYVRDNGHIEFLEKARLCEDFFAGLQWEEKIRKKLKSQGRPVMTINVTLATLNAIMGEQLQNRADVSFRPFRNGNEQTAEILDKVWMQIVNSNSVHDLEADMFDDGIITSRGFLDARIAFDDHLMGEVRIEHLSSRNVGIDPDAETYDPKTWKDVFISKWMTSDEIALSYNPRDAKILKNRPTSEWGHDSIDSDEKRGGFGGFDSRVADIKPDRRRIRVLERQFRTRGRKPHFVDPQTGDMRVVPTSWPRERIQLALQQFRWTTIERDTESIHWRVTADNVVLHDKPSPYSNFTVIPYFPFFRKGKTMGMAEHLVSLNEILNKTSSQELHIINSSANGGWKYKTGSLKNMDPDELEQRGAETGLVLELDDPNDAQKIAPNQIPTGIDRVTSKTREWIKDISGAGDSQRGFDREDVAAKAIREKRAASSVNLAKPFENLTRSRKLLANHVRDLMQGYYTEQRVLQITSDTPGAELEEITINQMDPETGGVMNDLTAGEYSVVVSSVPLRESYMESQFDETVRMREAGVAIPDEHLIKNSSLADKNELLASMRDSGAQELQRRQQEAAVRLAELENEEKEVEIERKRQEAGLAAARAEKTLVDAQVIATQPQQSGEQGNPLLEMAQAEEDAGLAREKALFDQRLQLRELQLKQDIALEELELKRDVAEQEQRLKQAEAEERAETARSQQRQQAQSANRSIDEKAHA